MLYAFFWVVPQRLNFICLSSPQPVSLPSHGSPRHAPYLLHVPARGLHVGRYPPQPVSVLGPAPTLSPSFLLAKAIFEAYLYPYKYHKILNPSHSSYLPAYEDGRDRVFRNVDI